MKRLFILLAFFYFTESSFAQNEFYFSDSIAQWNVLRTIMSMSPPPAYDWKTFVYKTDGDIVLGNTAYQIIREQSYNVVYYIRKDVNNKVYLIDPDNRGRLIYDFGMEVNDIMFVSNPLSQNGGMWCQVQSIDSIVMDIDRKRLHVKCGEKRFNNYYLNYADEWVEGIGALHTHFLYPGFDQSMADMETYDLSCYRKNDSLIYKYFTNFDCYVDSAYPPRINSIGNEVIENGISVYPNPSSQMINIQTENVQSSVKHVSVFDVTGKAMHGSTLLTMTNATVDVSHLPNGLYFLYVEMSNGQRVVRKVIKE